jgi:hypothetical protein
MSRSSVPCSRAIRTSVFCLEGIRPKCCTARVGCQHEQRCSIGCVRSPPQSVTKPSEKWGFATKYCNRRYFVNIGLMSRVRRSRDRALSRPTASPKGADGVVQQSWAFGPTSANLFRVGVQFFHDQVCRTELGPKFGPVARHRDSNYSCVLFSTPLISYVLQRLPFGC